MTPIKYEDNEDLPKLSVSQITKRLVQELAIATKSQDGKYTKTTMKWLHILAPDELKEDFITTQENTLKKRLTSLLSSAKSLHSTRRWEFLHDNNKSIRRQ